jgi:hypothetical protein
MGTSCSRIIRGNPDLFAKRNFFKKVVTTSDDADGKFVSEKCMSGDGKFVSEKCMSAGAKCVSENSTRWEMWCDTEQCQSVRGVKKSSEGQTDKKK